MSSPNVFNKKLFCVITGASKGIGREIAKQFASLAAPNSVFLIMARSQDKLEETASAMECTSVEIKVHDFGKPDYEFYKESLDLDGEQLCFSSFFPWAFYGQRPQSLI